MERRAARAGRPLEGGFGRPLEGGFVALFPVFLGMPDLEQVRADVKLTSEREYPLLNVYFIYMDKKRGGKYLDCTDPQETA